MDNRLEIKKGGKIMKRFLKRIHQGNKGFTLIELLIVVAIIGVLAAVIVPNVTGIVGRGEEAAARAELQTVQAAMDLAMVGEVLNVVTDGSAFTITDFGSTGGGDIDPDTGTTAYLYPNYLRVKDAGALLQDGTTATYSWTTGGQVSSTAFDAGGVWQ